MPKPQSFPELLAADKRYKRDAYAFVFEALRYAHDTLGMGTETPAEALEHPPVEPDSSEPGSSGQGSSGQGSSGQGSSGQGSSGQGSSGQGSSGQRHLTGGELCDAIRRYALEQFGYMAATVLGSWGIHKTGDFGDIVFNLIDIGEMSKTKHDRREDFDDVFDFETAFRRDYVIEPSRNTPS
jgi:uncharacterized repeat protein (TIGR04138 family)